MSGSAGSSWVNETELRIDDTTFCATPFERFESTATRFCVVKRPDLVDKYIRLLAELAPRRIVELGICKGGSTALLAALSGAETLVALEFDDERVAALDAYLERHDLADAVHAFYGVDQGDAARVREILATTIGRQEIDLVVDDASHDLALTRSSFNVLFPRLRPGGLFVIEDWSWAHLGYGAQRPEQTPLTALVFEIVMALPSRLGMIDDIVIDRDWAIIRRGAAEVDPSSFDISACYSDRSRRLVAPLSGQVGQPPLRQTRSGT